MIFAANANFKSKIFKNFHINFMHTRRRHNQNKNQKKVVKKGTFFWLFGKQIKNTNFAIN